MEYLGKNCKKWPKQKKPKETNNIDLDEKKDNEE